MTIYRENNIEWEVMYEELLGKKLVLVFQINLKKKSK